MNKNTAYISTIIGCLLFLLIACQSQLPIPPQGNPENPKSSEVNFYDAVKQAKGTWKPAPYELETSLFTLVDSEDKDLDYLKDDLEYELADVFKPYLFFDSSENHRLQDEPVTLFQVRPVDCIGVYCQSTEFKIMIKYALLFQTDGGYGPDSWCGDAHNGDNQSINLELVSNDGLSWKLKKISAGRFSVEVESGQGGRHVIIYLSGHKHHEYFHCI